MKNTVIIWRLTWSHEMGVYWLPLATCAPAAAESYMRERRLTDARGVTYAAAENMPAVPDNAQELARHIAVFN